MNAENVTKILALGGKSGVIPAVIPMPGVTLNSSSISSLIGGVDEMAEEMHDAFRNGGGYRAGTMLAVKNVGTVLSMYYMFPSWLALSATPPRLLYFDTRFIMNAQTLQYSPFTVTLAFLDGNGNPISTSQQVIGSVALKENYSSGFRCFPWQRQMAGGVAATGGDAKFVTAGNGTELYLPDFPQIKPFVKKANFPSAGVVDTKTDLEIAPWIDSITGIALQIAASDLTTGIQVELQPHCSGDVMSYEAVREFEAAAATLEALDQ
jgi:hypothetical protein